MTSRDFSRTSLQNEDAARLVTRLTRHDILMGRGAPTAYYTGNIAFRELVATRKQEYVTADSQRRKQEIAKQLYEDVGRLSGRFLARMEPSRSIALGAPAGETAWYIVEPAVALEKVKQALREKHVNDAPMQRKSSRPQGVLTAYSEPARVEVIQNSTTTLPTPTGLDRTIPERSPTEASVPSATSQSMLIAQLGGVYRPASLGQSNNLVPRMEATANAFDMRRIPHTFATLQPEQQAISSFGSMPHQPFTLLLGQYRQQLELIRCHEQANSQQLLLQQRLRQHHSSSSTAMTNHSPITRPRWSDHATYAGNSHIATQSNDSSGPDVYRARANNREQILFPTMLTPATEAHQQDHLDRTLALLLRGSDSTTLAASAAGGAALASSIAGGISHSRNGSAPTLAESTFTTSLMRHIPATADTSSNLALRRSACTPLLHAHELSSQSLHRSPTDISTRIATPAETRVPPTHATVRATASLPQSQDDDNGDVYDDSKPSARKRARAARLSTEQSDFAA